MFTLNKEKFETVMPTPWGTFTPGREADLSRVPASVKKQWIEDKIFVQNENAPDLFEDMPEDALSGMNRDTLKHFIVNNKIPVQVKLKWSDEEIRQAIREMVDPEELAVMLAPKTEVPAPSGSTSEGGSLAAPPPQQ